ncbi:MAG TPA: hypothetical protein VF008_21895 [Niastella sp.]
MNTNKQIKAYDIMLQSHIDKKDFVNINRTFNGEEERIGGFILSMSKDFLLIQVDNELSFNGYAIIRKDQLDSLRCNKYDKTIKKIYKGEGLLKNGYGIDKNISLKSWQAIFSDLKKFDYHVIIECEDREESTFDIGPIKKALKGSVSIQYYDPTGQLENKLTPLKYSDITKVQFGDHYSMTYRKYLKPTKKEK